MRWREVSRRWRGCWGEARLVLLRKQEHEQSRVRIHQDVGCTSPHFAVENGGRDQPLERGRMGMADLVGLHDLAGDHGQIEVAAEHLRHRIWMALKPSVSSAITGSRSASRASAPLPDRPPWRLHKQDDCRVPGQSCEPQHPGSRQAREASCSSVHGTTLTPTRAPCGLRDSRRCPARYTSVARRTSHRVDGYLLSISEHAPNTRAGNVV